MKVVYQTCCGVDVHKSFLVATIIKTSSGVQPSYQKKRFSTFNNSILQFKEWLLLNECRDVCMESTGKYWVPVFNLLEDDINVTIANPKWVKAVKGNKDDTKDSPKYRIRLVRTHLDYITSAINDIDTMLDSLIVLMKMPSSCYVPFRVLAVTVQSLLSPKLVRSKTAFH